MKKATFIFLTAILLFGCTDTINKKLSKDSFNDDVKTIKEKYAKDYTAEDFAEFRERASNKITAQLMGINKGENVTYKSILDTVKAQRLRDDSIMIIYNAELKKLNDALLISIDSGQYLKGPKGEAYVYKISWQNKTDKKVIALEGMFIIKSPLGDIVKKIYIKQNATILPKENGSAPMADDIFDWDKPDELAKYEFKNLKAEWKPEKIVFDDNSNIIAPDQPKN